MKILFISHEASRSGAPIVLLNLLRWIKNNRKDMECTLLLVKQGPLEEEFRKYCTVELLQDNTVSKLPNRLKTVLSANRLTKKLKQLARNGIDLVYSNTIVNGYLLSELKSIINVPVIVHVHEMKQTIREFGEKNLLENLDAADCIIANSKLTAQQLLELCEEQKKKINTKVVWPFIDDNEVKIPGQKKDDFFIVGGSGSFEWRKGIELFIYVAAAVCTKRSNVNFMWVGGDHSSVNYTRYQYLVEQLCIKDQIKFIEATNDPASWFKSFDIFFLSSIEEPFSLVSLENALLKIPVVCFQHCSGMEELLIPGAGRAFPLADISAAATGIIELIDDGELRIKMGEQGNNLVRAHGLTRTNAHLIMECIDKLLETA